MRREMLTGIRATGLRVTGLRATGLRATGLGVAVLVTLTGCGGGNGSGRAATEPGSRDTKALATQPIASKTDPRTITVQATGRVKGKPDTMTISIGVQSRGDTAQAALNQNSDRATKVVGSLKAAGISSDDIQTSQLSVNPTFDNNGNHITGYEVSNMVTAKLHQIDGAGKVIDAAANQAGDDIRVNGVQFSIEDTGKLVSAARADAVKQAQQQANEFAKAAGVSVGAVQQISETASPAPMPLQYTGAAGAAKSVAPVESGTQELTVQITAVYAIA